MLQGNVLSWASDLDGGTLAQAQRTAALSIVEKPLALMADTHVGMGADDTDNFFSRRYKVAVASKVSGVPLIETILC